jgi:hypothetical protein
MQSIKASSHSCNLDNNKSLELAATITCCSCPDDYETQDKWPTILFLHGAGEKGSNLEYVQKARRPQDCRGV